MKNIMDKAWNNQNISLFNVTEETRPLLMLWAGIETLSYSSPKSILENVYSFEDARVIISGQLPFAKMIFELHDGSGVDVINFPCSNRFIYSTELVVMRMRNIRIDHMETTDLYCPDRVDDSSAVKALAVIYCDLDIIFID